ncbi:DUF559 domain-containing protein [Ornithinibacillus sp. JPR2-1]|uniref:endonuclease domain-containing protein n=1 Tax=Ornithinibacillus sp. JPR2-1 TaxID=2094019 RepID=UPI0031E25781
MARNSVDDFISNQKKAFKKLPKRVRDEINKSQDARLASLVFATNRCESPIEQLLMIYLYDLETELRTELGDMELRTHVKSSAQENVVVNGKRYRLDFFIECTVGDTNHKFAIECDGHDFHEKTKEQAARDKSKDRNLASEGYTVIRFTGAEIWDRPVRCISEISDIIYTKTGLKDYWDSV